MKKVPSTDENTNNSICNYINNIFDKINSYIFISSFNSQDSKIMYANELLRDLFNLDIIGKTPQSVFGINFLKTVEDQSYNFLWHKKSQWFNVSTSLIIGQNNEKSYLTSLVDISEKIEYERLIERQIYLDNLSGLPNRRKFEVDFHHAVAYAKKIDSQGHLFFIDLDDFSKINDTRGHKFGDILIKEIANFLSSFEKDGILSYRFGGDEFAIILPANSPISKNTFLNILHSAFEKEWLVDKYLYNCNASIGIAEFPNHGNRYSEIMKSADMALAYAKNSGKNTSVEFTTNIKDEIYREIELEHCMHNDVRDGFKNFSVHYQALINSQTQVVEGCEALLRWNCSSLGSISPNEFIPLAEKKGYICQIGEFVLRQATAQCKKWLDRGYNIKVSINISIVQLMENNFLEKVTNIINESGASYKNLILEITESIAINDLSQMKYIFNELNSLGLSIALDDFGTGYSSLNCLKEIPLSTIKIDKNFIDDIVYNPSTAIFVR
ncbi:MAG: EAL domain-containing protein, partial [Clostridiales bacterium]|nr:EAL domain-containing protein [Clostridiales bacterium]